MRVGIRFGAVALTIFGLASPATGAAQERNGERPAWSITPMFGVFTYEFADDETFPIFAVRFSRPVDDYVRLEVDVSAARTNVQTDALGFYDPSLPDEKSTLFSVTLGIQGRYLAYPVELYGGAAGGLLNRRDDDSDRVRTSQTTFSLPAGVRVFVNDNWGLRAELRYRRDAQALGAPSLDDLEKMVGISWTF